MNKILISIGILISLVIGVYLMKLLIYSLSAGLLYIIESPVEAIIYILGTIIALWVYHKLTDLYKQL